MPGTLTPRKSRPLLKYRLACPARSASASGSIAAITAAAAASASKRGLLTGPRYRAGGWETDPMPRQNRVTPYGKLVAVPDRGLFWGNRGQLLDREGRLARYSRGRGWVICVLSFKGRRRQQWQPGRLTELYLLDEATGLDAGRLRRAARHGPPRPGDGDHPAGHRGRAGGRLPACPPPQRGPGRTLAVTALAVTGASRTSQARRAGTSRRAPSSAVPLPSRPAGRRPACPPTGP